MFQMATNKTPNLVSVRIYKMKSILTKCSPHKEGTVESKQERFLQFNLLLFFQEFFQLQNQLKKTIHFSSISLYWPLSDGKILKF